MSRNATLLGLATLLFAFGAAPAALAQTVTGTVTDAASGDPLPFVNVVLQGTTRGAATNIDGEYSIEVDGPASVLVYRFLGYIEHVETVGGRTTINVEMSEDSNLLDDVVVVGYGVQRRGDVTASVAAIDVDEANVGLVTSATDYIEGRVAGVQLTPSGGQPGAGVSVRIRGGTSITASNEPLYVIDGVPVDGRAVTPAGSGQVSNGPAGNPLSLINPNDIESISVLKDASATAIYGSRGANGVVLITTRDGASGQSTITYEAQGAVSTSPQFDLLTADEYRAFFQRTDLDFGDQTGPQILASQEIGNFSTDFQDAVFRDAVSQSHNFSFSNGTENAQYRASLSYLNNEGTVISTGQERITARLNANNQFFDDRFRIGLNLTSALTNDDFAPINATGGFEGGALQNLIDYRPILPITDESELDGFYEIPSQRSVRNPVALLEQVDESARTTRTLGNLSAEFDIIDGLTLQGLVGGDRSVGRRRSFIPSASPFGADFTDPAGNAGTAYQQDLERTSTTLSTYLNYTPQIAENQSVSLLAGYEYNEFDTQQFGVQAQGFVTDLTADFNISGAGLAILRANNAGPGSFSNRAINRLRSFFARANYNFAERYYLTASVRRDGSSRFAPDNRYAIFPAVSAAWRLSEESFLADNSVISDLRLRAGFGVVGNQDIPDYLFLDLVGPTSNAVFNGTQVVGYSQTQLANPDLKWEEKREVTVGLDYGLLQDRLYGSLEFYQNTTEDLLLVVPVAGAAVSTQLQNIGSIRNTGIDFAVEGFLIDRPGLSLRLNGVFNTNKNEVLELGGREEILFGPVQGRGQSGTNSLRLAVGEAFPVFYGPVFTGTFDDGGNPVFEDVNGDGEVNISGDDRTNLGSPDPDFTYGFGLNLAVGDFGLRTFFRGEQGREVFNNGALVYATPSVVVQGRNFIDVDYAFSPEAGEALSAAPVFSSRYIEDASFLRLDNVTLEYNVPTQIFGDVVRGIRTYLSADNLFVLTPYTGLDPEVSTSVSSTTDAQGQPTSAIPSRGVDYLNYPRPRTISIGAVLSL